MTTNEDGDLVQTLDYYPYGAKRVSAGVRRPGALCLAARGWREVLEPVIARYRGRGFVPYFRGDAAFAKPELYELLEAEGQLHLPGAELEQTAAGPST